MTFSLENIISVFHRKTSNNQETSKKGQDLQFPDNIYNIFGGAVYKGCIKICLNKIVKIMICQ